MRNEQISYILSHFNCNHTIWVSIIAPTSMNLPLDMFTFPKASCCLSEACNVTQGSWHNGMYTEGPLELN